MWSGIKKLTEHRTKVSKSALELAKAAGWDMEMMQLETRITSALAALEDCGFLKREQNAYRIFANSFLVKDINKVNEIINQSTFILDKDKEHAIRIVQRIIKADETRVDYLSETLAIPKEDIMRVLGFLRHEGIIGDAKDLTAFIDHSSSASSFVSRFNKYAKIEQMLLSILPLATGIVHLKEINEKLIAIGVKDASIDAIKDILNFWQIRNYIHKERLDKSLHTYSIKLKKDSELFKSEVEKRIILAKAVTDYLSKKLSSAVKEEASDTKEILLEFSVLELQKGIEKVPAIFDCGFSLGEYEEALLYLNAISALKLEGGFLVLYKPMVIERVEEDRKKRYTENEYEKLASFYKNKTQQIHIVGEYAKKMIANYGEALQFTDDYFTLEYNSFLKKYFPKRLHEISRPLTPEKFKAIFGALSPEQLEIINDNKSEHIVVAAGPGSGKTRVLVHKVASLLMLEDIKPEGFLMLTFSRAAAIEFKERLHALIGNVAYYIDIHTYHSYCFNLMGRVGSLEKSDTVISECIEQILDGIIPESKIGIKSVLVVDEFQDINEQESRLLIEIISRCEKIRVLVVGDDDQNIYEFRGSSVKYMQNFESQNKARRYELITNFRSKQNLVAFANKFVATIPHRMKKEHIVAKAIEDGSICIHNYKSSNLITPLVNNIASTELSGTTSVLTTTNQEAILIESMLKGKGLPARRILSHEGFSLSELIEIKSFTNLLKSTISASSQMIAEDVWQETKQTIIEEQKQSKNLWLFEAVTACFEKNYTRKIIFEWGLFLKESRFEDFYYSEKNIITVSTMHKAKGKEFDNVFLLLDEFEITKDADRRIIYVAITRAKQNLIIHTNTSHFNRFHVSNLKILTDKALYKEPKDLHIYLNHRDVFLNCFKKRSVAYAIDKMCAGEKVHLEVDGYTLTNSASKKVGVLSKEFQKTLKKHMEDGYRIKDIEVDFIVYWKDVADNGEYKILLPKFVTTKFVNHAIFSR